MLAFKMFPSKCIQRQIHSLYMYFIHLQDYIEFIDKITIIEKESAFFFGSSIVDIKRRALPWQNISASLGIALSRGILLSLPLKHPLQLAFYLATRTKYQRGERISPAKPILHVVALQSKSTPYIRINIQGPCGCHPLCISSYPADFNARSLRLTRCERESCSEIVC